jgi:hypothetical protein
MPAALMAQALRRADLILGGKPEVYLAGKEVDNSTLIGISLSTMKRAMSPTPNLALTISRKLKSLLVSHKPMNQRDLAFAIGIPTMVLNRALRGESTPAADAIIKIAAYFKITTDELLGVTVPKKPGRKVAS